MLPNTKHIELYDTQHRFFMCDDRFAAFIGGVGSGKTFAGAVDALVRAKEPNTLGLVVAPTYPMLKDATVRTFADVAGGAIESHNKSDMTTRIRGGGEILFRSADNPDRLRGPNLHWAWLDEAAMCRPGTFEIIIGRLRAGDKAGPLRITTTPKGRNWLWQRRDDITIFKASSHDNPYIDAEFARSLDRNYTGEFARQEIYGEFAHLEGLVYPQFDRDVHVLERNPLEFVRWALAIDEGYTNPAVVLLVGYDNDDRMHVLREFYERGKLQSEVVDIASQWFAEFNCFTCAVDASAAGLIADLRNAGVGAMPQKGRVLDGISAIQSRLKVQGDGRPRLTLDPSCENGINEFESHLWKSNKDEPVKENDHWLDAIRYLNTSTANTWFISSYDDEE
jgi:phage terminase large subunit